MAEGSFGPREARRLTGAERGSVNTFLGSMHRLASIPHVCPSRVVRLVQAAVDRMRRDAPTRVRGASGELLRAAEALGQFIRWVSASDATAAVCAPCGARGLTAADALSSFGTFGGESAADIIFGSVLILRSAAYTCAHASVAADLVGAAATRSCSQSLARMYLDSISRAVSSAAVPTAPPIDTLFSGVGESGGPQRGRARRRSQRYIADAQRVASAKLEASDALRSWLASTDALLYSLEHVNVRGEVKAVDVGSPSSSVRAETAVQIIASRMHSRHIRRACGLSGGRAQARGGGSLLSCDACAGIVSAACEVDIVFHSRQWAVVSDSYFGLIGRRVAPHAPQRRSDAGMLVISAARGSSPVLMAVPYALHSRCFSTLSRFAPLRHCVAMRQAAAAILGTDDACASTALPLTLARELEGHLALAAVSARLPISSIAACSSATGYEASPATVSDWAKQFD